MDDEVKFVELWEAGVKLSEITRILNIDYNRIYYLRNKTKVAPRRDVEAQRKRHEEVWQMIQKRIPIEEIVATKGVTEIYVIQVINKKGYKVREFYSNRKKTKQEKKQKEKQKIVKTRNGVKCTPGVMAKCKYGTYTCDYLLITGHRRPCTPDDCTCFKKQKKERKNGKTEMVVDQAL